MIQERDKEKREKTNRIFGTEGEKNEMPFLGLYNRKKHNKS